MAIIKQCVDTIIASGTTRLFKLTKWPWGRGKISVYCHYMGVLQEIPWEQHGNEVTFAAIPLKDSEVTIYYEVL